MGTGEVLGSPYQAAGLGRSGGGDGGRDANGEGKIRRFFVPQFNAHDETLDSNGLVASYAVRIVAVPPGISLTIADKAYLDRGGHRHSY